MKFLFIDDDGNWLNSLKRCLTRGKDNIVMSECHSLEEALMAIDNNKPEVVFVDHRLTENGSEGLEIVKRIKGVKFYSTTASSELVKVYAEYGVEWVGKTDLKKLMSIISG